MTFYLLVKLKQTPTYIKCYMYCMYINLSSRTLLLVTVQTSVVFHLGTFCQAVETHVHTTQVKQLHVAELIAHLV